MLSMTHPVEDRIRDLHATADDLRTERILAARSRRTTGGAQALRVRIGRALIVAGAALAAGASPTTATRASR